MRILLTNDDGIHARGLQELAASLALDHSITIVAPDSERSAVSHGLTIRTPLFIRTHTVGHLTGTAVSGTPADCVKLGIDKLVEAEPDLVVSGINNGANTGVNVFYSGTVAAALEASFSGIPAIAVSIGSFTPAHYQDASRITSAIIRLLDQYAIPAGVVLNINIPNLPESEIRGIRITRQSRIKFKDSYLRRENPNGAPYFWLDGDQPEEIADLDLDEYALRQGWISITPLVADFNAMESVVREVTQWIRSTSLLETSFSSRWR